MFIYMIIIHKALQKYKNSWLIARVSTHKSNKQSEMR